MGKGCAVALGCFQDRIKEIPLDQDERDFSGREYRESRIESPIDVDNRRDSKYKHGSVKSIKSKK